MQSSVLYCKKAYNSLNIQEKNLDIYFQIALMVNQISLWTEFATMSFFSMPQSKGVFLQSARDLAENGCSIPYRLCVIGYIDTIWILIFEIFTIDCAAHTLGVLEYLDHVHCTNMISDFQPMCQHPITHLIDNILWVFKSQDFNQHNVP